MKSTKNINHEIELGKLDLENLSPTEYDMIQMHTYVKVMNDFV